MTLKLICEMEIIFLDKSKDIFETNFEDFEKFSTALANVDAEYFYFQGKEIDPKKILHIYLKIY